MNAVESPEMKQFRTVAATARFVVLLGVIAVLAAIGANAPDRSQASLGCAYASAAGGTLSDAPVELPGTCASVVQESAPPALAEAKSGVPDAKSVLDPHAQPEPQPATF